MVERRADGITRALIEKALQEKDQAYSERNRAIQLLTKLLPAHLRRHEPVNDPSWDPKWRWVVCIHLPGATPDQLTWHIHEDELPWFDHLPRHPDPGTVNVFGMTHPIQILCDGWDGHTTEEKHARIQSYASRYVFDWPGLC